MIEKYGTDPDAISPADDQLRKIKALAKAQGKDYDSLGPIRSYKQANDLIDSLEKEA